MSEEEWEQLCSTLVIAGYLPSIVKVPPTIIVRGEHGTKMLRRSVESGRVVVSVGLAEQEIINPTVESLVNLLVETIGSPHTTDQLLTFSAAYFGLKVIRPMMDAVAKVTLNG